MKKKKNTKTDSFKTFFQSQSFLLQTKYGSVWYKKRSREGATETLTTMELLPDDVNAWCNVVLQVLVSKVNCCYIDYVNLRFNHYHKICYSNGNKHGTPTLSVVGDGLVLCVYGFVYEMPHDQIPVEPLDNFLGNKIACSPLHFAMILRRFKLVYYNTRFRRLSSLLCLIDEQWWRARIFHPSRPSDGDIKWQFLEKDPESLAQHCLVTLWALVEKRRRISSMFIHDQSGIWFSMSQVSSSHVNLT